jgi:predicted ATPase
MITRVRVKNFRSLADVDVTLGPLTVLVGRNGAGKSAFVDALCFVRDALRSGIGEALSKRNGLGLLRTRPYNGASNEMSFHIWIETKDFKGEYGFSITKSAEDSTYSVSREFAALESVNFQGALFEIKDRNWIVPPPDSAFLPGSSTHPLLFDSKTLFLPSLASVKYDTALLLHALLGSNFYGIFPITDLRTPQARQEWYPLLKNGSNLASVLWQMQSDGNLPILFAALRGAIPDIIGVGIDETGDYLFVKIQHKSIGEKNSAEWFQIAQESDGTIHLLAVLAALYQSLGHPPALFPLIAVEEPETALYPAAVGVLSDVIKEASCRSQIIITTQSPDFISEFEPGTLRVVEKVNGVTHIGEIDERQLGIIHDQLFTTGDLLRIEGLHSLPTEPVSAEDA